MNPTGAIDSHTQLLLDLDGRQPPFENQDPASALDLSVSFSDDFLLSLPAFLHKRLCFLLLTVGKTWLLTFVFKSQTDTKIILECFSFGVTVVCVFS